MKTTISLAATVPGGPSYVEIQSEVEWRESMKFLKVEFPVDVVNTEAAYESQFGIVRRPTHYNTRLASNPSPLAATWRLTAHIIVGTWPNSRSVVTSGPTFQKMAMVFLSLMIQSTDLLLWETSCG